MVELVDIDEDYGDLSLTVTKVLLAFLDAVAHQTRDQDVDDLEQLCVFLALPEVRHELQLFAKLVIVSVYYPKEHDAQQEKYLDVEFDFVVNLVIPEVVVF